MHCLQAVDGHCRVVWDRRLRHLSQEYDRPRNGNGNTYVSLALPCFDDKIDAAFARLSALLAGCGPPITQDYITTIKSRISLMYPHKALSRDGYALPRAAGSWWAGGERLPATAARTCRLNNFALRSKNVAFGRRAIDSWNEERAPSQMCRTLVEINRVLWIVKLIDSTNLSKNMKRENFNDVQQL